MERKEPGGERGTRNEARTKVREQRALTGQDSTGPSLRKNAAAIGGQCPAYLRYCPTVSGPLNVEQSLPPLAGQTLNLRNRAP